MSNGTIAMLRRGGALLLAGGLMLTLAACSVSVGAPPADTGMPQFGPKDPNAAIKAVSVGTSDTTETFDHQRTSTSFAAGTARVAVWYRWEGGQGKRIDIRWTTGGEVILEQNETLDAATGESAWFLTTGSGGAMPAGQYQVELLENGSSVTAIPFSVSGS